MKWNCPHCKRPFTHVDALLGHVQKDHKAADAAIEKRRARKKA